MKVAEIVMGVGTATCGLGCTGLPNSPVYSLEAAPVSEVRTETDARTSAGDWGTFFQYFNEATPIVDDVNVGVAKIKAGGFAPHPPHKHAEEEYIIVLKGRGTWYLNGETFPAKEGDVLYAKAWDYHGIKSDPESPLDFYIVKYTGTGMEMPPDPDPSQPLEVPF